MGTPLQWMTSYLTDRYQLVCIDGELSEAVHMTYSVPQGSLLCPKNYIMSLCTQSLLGRFEEITVYLTTSTPTIFSCIRRSNPTTTWVLGKLHRVKSCLSDIASRMHINMLKLHTDKTEVIVFSSKHNEQFVGDISVTVGTSQIKPSPVVRNLGAFFDSRMEHGKSHQRCTSI